MRATWWFARQGLAARRGRTALLALAVVLASTLVTAVACGLESARGNAEASLRRSIGGTDARLVNRFGAAFAAVEADRVRGKVSLPHNPQIPHGRTGDLTAEP